MISFIASGQHFAAKISRNGVLAGHIMPQLIKKANKLKK
jgi:hypothetical protein